jgi:hypothetical protein
MFGFSLFIYEPVGTGAISKDGRHGDSDHMTTCLAGSLGYRFHQASVSAGSDSVPRLGEQTATGNSVFVCSVAGNRLGGSEDGDDLVAHGRGD